MPDVTIHLFATLRQHANGRAAVNVAIEPGQTIEQTLAQLGVPADQARLVFCDNRRVARSHPLAGGETLGIFPVVAGG